MSANAGRILLIPKGAYDSDAAYEMLDVVYHNNNTFICKKPCSNVEPTDGEFWMKALEQLQVVDDLNSDDATKALSAKQGKNLDAKVMDLKMTLSDEWTSGKAYAQGEFCIYNNTLWKSKVNNNAGNTPTEGSYWTATNVGTVVSGISSDLSEKVGKNEVKNFTNFNKVYPIGTSRLDMINDLANSLADGQGATFSVIINGDNWMFGFITKYDSTQNGGFMVDASGTRYSFTSLSEIREF